MWKSCKALLAQSRKSALLSEKTSRSAQKVTSKAWGVATWERQAAERLEWLDQEHEWSLNRTAVRNQFRDLAAVGTPSAYLKRRLVGDPRLRRHNDIEYIDRLKKEDIQQDRERFRKIHGAMRDCAQSRQELVRMQRLLQPPETTVGDDIKAVCAELKLSFMPH